jgi:hypothetical protein
MLITVENGIKPTLQTAYVELNNDINFGNQHRRPPALRHSMTKSRYDLPRQVLGQQSFERAAESHAV